jgi:HK97 gp10 family phage protein
MADGVTIELEGVEKLLDNLKRYQIVKTEACRNVLKAAGFAIATDAKRYCPVLTGRLRASLSVNWSSSGMTRGKVNGKAEAEDGVGQPAGKPGLVVVVGSNVQYAPYVEEGSRYMPARHYLFRAYRDHRDKIEQRLKDILGKKD